MCRVRLDLADGTTGGYNKDKELLVSKSGKDWNTYSDFGINIKGEKERSALGQRWFVCNCNWDGWEETGAWEKRYGRSYACAQPERLEGIRVAPASVAQPLLFYLPRPR